MTGDTWGSLGWTNAATKTVRSTPSEVLSARKSLMFQVKGYLSKLMVLHESQCQNVSRTNIVFLQSTNMHILYMYMCRYFLGWHTPYLK